MRGMRKLPLMKRTNTNNPTLWVFVKDNYREDRIKLKGE